MSETQAAPAQPGTPLAEVKKLNAIQIIEQDLSNYIQQHEQAKARTHALEGAIQSMQRLLQALKAEAIKAAAVVEAPEKTEAVAEEPVVQTA
jgi:flagellin-like hook-associated protein FlgL